MTQLNWTFDQLKFQLSRRPDIKAWIVTQEHTHRRELYFMTEKSHLITDQDRNIHSGNISIKLFVPLEKKGRQGEITKKLFTSLPLESQIDLAIEAAKQTDHQAWELPVKLPHEIPVVLTTDPNIAEDLEQVVSQITHRIEASVSQKRPSQFNSAELFLSIHTRELHLSNGLNHRSSQSKIYFESAYSFSQLTSDGKNHSDEYLTTQWAVHLDHLPIETILDQTAKYAENSLEVNKPITGKYPVIISAEVLSTLLNDQLTQLSAFNSYHSLPFTKIGEELIPLSHGDLLSITLDPTLDFGAHTVAISNQGLVQTPLKLVEKNRIVASTVDKQYGDYLGLKPNTSQGNLVVDPGTLTYSQLTQSAPYVIEILQFSGLFTDANSGTFSSEIRLAKLYDNAHKKVTYLKGGSLSGSIGENFRDLRLSNERVNRVHFSSDSTHGQGYYGPEYALLSDVSIVG